MGDGLRLGTAALMHRPAKLCPQSLKQAAKGVLVARLALKPIEVVTILKTDNSWQCARHARCKDDSAAEGVRKDLTHVVFAGAEGVRVASRITSRREPVAGDAKLCLCEYGKLILISDSI